MKNSKEEGVTAKSRTSAVRPEGLKTNDPGT